MTWIILLPARPSKQFIPPATVTVNRGDGRFQQRMLLTFRVADVEGVPPWCKADAPVTVEQGTGEDAGRYRITPGGPWRLRRSAGRRSSVTLKLPPPPNAPVGGCRQLAVEYDLSDLALAIVLPKLQPALQPHDAAPAVKAAYVGISDRVPDPAKAIQAANGGRVR